jgi:hypothetical protein
MAVLESNCSKTIYSVRSPPATRIINRFESSSLWLLTGDGVLINWWCHYRNSRFVSFIYLYRWLYIVNMVQLRIEAFRHLYSPISLYCPWRRKLQNIMYCCLLFPGRYDGLKTMQLNYILYC